VTVQKWGYRELVKLMIQDLFHFKVIETTSKEIAPKLISQEAVSFKSSFPLF
tara:strand:+ start:1406 stop:1561 length:156 start_codon:yes stop_codon:yes gene_type:complete